MKRLFVIAFLLICTPALAQNVVIDGREHNEVEVLNFNGVSAPSTSVTNEARMYLDSTSGTLKCSQDGGAYADCFIAGALLDTDIDTFSELDAIVADKSLVNTADGATWTGSHIFSGANLELPNATTATSADCDNATEAGRIWIDTDAASGSQLYVCEGAAGWVLQAGGGVTLINDLGNADAAGSVALAGYQQTWTSTLNSAGANLTLTNTTADLTADVSFIDLKYTDDGDANGYFLRGYDNSAGDLKWSIGADGAFTGLSFEASATSTAAGYLKLYEDTDDGSNYYQINGVATAADLQWILPAANGTAGQVLEIASVDTNTLTLEWDDDTDTKTDTKCVWIENPTESDDLKSIIVNKTANDWTLTEMWGESDQTVNFDFQVDDGSPADVNGTDLAPAAGEAEDTSLSGDTTLAAGEELDLAITSVADNPTWFSACVTYTY